MQSKPPLGFKPLSKRYPMFPILLNSSKSMQSIEPRPAILWKPLEWLRNQWVEGFDREPPAWFPVPSPWRLILIDGREFKLSDDEKHQYLEQLQIHDMTMQIMAGIEYTRNAYKTGQQ